MPLAKGQKSWGERKTGIETGQSVGGGIDRKKKKMMGRKEGESTEVDKRRRNRTLL